MPVSGCLPGSNESVDNGPGNGGLDFGSVPCS